MILETGTRTVHDTLGCVRAISSSFGGDPALGGLDRVVLPDVRFSARVEQDLEKCVKARTPVSWRVKLLSKGKVELGVTYEESEPALMPEKAGGVLGVDVNADHLAVARVSGDGR